MENQHLEAMLNKESVRSITRMIKQFQNEIERIEGFIRCNIDAELMPMSL
jgi:hypothetical protein